MQSCELMNALVAALTIASAQADEAPAQTFVQPSHTQVAEAHNGEARSPTVPVPRKTQKLPAPAALSTACNPGRPANPANFPATFPGSWLPPARGATPPLPPVDWDMIRSCDAPGPVLARYWQHSPAGLTHL